MISFKLFVEAIHQAISHAGDSLMDRSEGLLEKYFIRNKDGDVLAPRIVKLEYPTLDDGGNVINTEIQVPLITLVPISSSKIEKATLTAEIQLEVINDELQVSFSKKKSSNGNATFGKLEIVISPQETADGLESIIEGYSKTLKRQLT